jgi:hypothetical protein
MATCTASVPDKDISGDNLYGPRSCWQPFVDWAWHTHDMHKGDWDDGWGFNDCCNTDKPLARTFNGIWLLNYSAEDYWNDDYSNDMLHWARHYVRDNVAELHARCGNGSAIATAFWGPFTNDRIELYLGFFYSQDVVARAATLVHECRHVGPGISHNAKFPAGSVFGAGGGGADSSWDYHGAWMYGALYLWWFFAAAARTTPALQQSARQSGNLIIDNAFAKHPGFTIS